ncbi:uncharacterized protein [Physcomitrium patens]|uniref:TF-B3 domain-containing protein n=1 Tax=Physcomitrium patens TaxID=3218 RepID=A0A2K1J3N0_PHYPA|nr:uncharacterized protein LOC112294814 isoform X2 [Physcomitrium patens]PNR36139.1 hypothetical protein PHYPA_021990 [Physcomitrium patens]|eukprot:XP_024401457.1 uncharacterized protein LOC112294814 isoform X2 [Physcomitrella patens]
MEKATSYNLQQREDAGLWKELLRTARQGTTNKSFFVVDVVGSCLHTAMFCKLELPTVFLDHHIKSLKEKLTLQGPDGHRWPAMLGMTLDSKTCIMQGWQEVAADYNLEVKDQVVFFLLNDSHFMIQVFDDENNVKLRVLPSTDREAQSNGDFSKARSKQLTRELAEKAKTDVRASAQEEDLPLLRHSTVDGNEVLHIPDSSEDEEHVPSQHRNLDDGGKVNAVSPIATSVLKIRPEKNHTRCNSEVTKVDAEDRTGTTPEDMDLQILVPLREPAEMELRKNLRRISGVDDDDDNDNDVQNERNSSIIENLTGNQATRRSIPVSSEPSSSELVITRSRSRKLQRKTGGYKDDNDLYTSSTVRKLGCEEQVFNGEKADSGCNREKRLTQRRSLGMKKMLEMPPVRAVKEPSSNLDLGTSEVMLQENVESRVIHPAAPRTLRELRRKTLAKSRNNGKVSEDSGEKKAANVDPPEDVVKPVYKRPKPMKIGGMAPPKEPPILYISKRRPVTDKERQQALITAQEFANMSKNKHYVMQLKKTQVYCGFHLKVPKEMVDALQLPLKTMELMLCDSTGRKWLVEWMGAHPKHPGINSKGWTRFVLEHHLEEGDCCVFDLPDPWVSNISVQIFPVVPLVESSENGWRDHYIFAQQGVQKEMGSPSGRSPAQNYASHAQAWANST